MAQHSFKTKPKPILAITQGDAAGIGPEVVVKALLDAEIYHICAPVVIGDRTVVQNALNLTGAQADLNPIQHPAERRGRCGTIDLIDLHNLSPNDFRYGEVSTACGKSSVEYIIKAAQLALHKEVAAIVTAPINKEATRKAGYGELGHLELLAHYTDARDYATMLVSGPLRVVHLTTHYSLKEALNYITKDFILRRLTLIQRSFAAWQIPRPRIAVAALNPHGGESGILGREEIEYITPAVVEAQMAGIDARGPFPADSVFGRAINGDFNVVLAMYHDQGHIPIKVYDFTRSVSVALGLPFIRTSVDHGTAFDIAGKGIARSDSLKEAIKTAVRLIDQHL
jgi:4-phospho-D-threonate 3-dehydrogenase / 4-phospho-D-erythronate 3-dehydrogenase